MISNEQNRACDIVSDLIPLYLDDVCSEGSKAFTEEHIAKCEKCRKTLEIMRGNTAESLLDHEKKTALTLHKKQRDGRILNSILWSIVAAYVPIVFILPLFLNETGIVPTNYPFELLTVFLFTLPFLTSLISLGFTMSKAINRHFPDKKAKATNVAEAAAALVTVAACFNLQKMLYLAIFGSLVSIILWIISAAEKKRTDIHKKTFIFCFLAVFTVFLALIIGINAISTGNARPDPLEPKQDYSYSQALHPDRA